LRILIATSELPPTRSGMARVATNLIDGFKARGHEVDVLASERLPRIAWRDVRVPLLLPRWRSFSQRARRADVISLHGPIPGFSDLILAWSRVRPSTPIAYTHHMDIRFRHARAITSAYGAMYRRLANGADVTIVSTCATARAFDGRNVHVVPFGVEHERVRRDVAIEDRFSVLFVGQLRPYKGVDVLLRAMAHLPDVHLTVVGRGYAEADLRALAGRLSLRNVTFAGAPDDGALWEMYARHHVFAQPSLEMEYFGLASLEAMASGCVPVITALPGPTEVVGDAGIVVPPGDASALAARIARLRDEPTLRQELSERARARAAAFTWDRCVERHLQVYASVLR
jgi:rhamnosyl/mannosyltransferase